MIVSLPGCPSYLGSVNVSGAQDSTKGPTAVGDSDGRDDDDDSDFSQFWQVRLYLANFRGRVTKSESDLFNYLFTPQDYLNPYSESEYRALLKCVGWPE